MNIKKKKSERWKAAKSTRYTYNNFDDILVLKSPVHLCFFHGILYTLAAKRTSNLLESVKSAGRHVLDKIHEAESSAGRNENRDMLHERRSVGGSVFWFKGCGTVDFLLHVGKKSG